MDYKALEPEKNSSKKIIILVIGIAILVIATIGISFAFFSYTKIGQNNTVTTGDISIYLTENSTINISNQFPMKDSDALSNNPGIQGESGETVSMNFTITGYSSNENVSIPYRIYAIAGATQSAPKVKFANSQINVFMTATPGIGTQTITNYIAPTNSHTVSNDVDTETGWLIATGTIKEGTLKNNPQVDSYELKMYINDTVRISDTNTTVSWKGVSLPTSYCASDRVLEGGVYKSGCKIYKDTSNNNQLTVAGATDTASAHTYLTTYSNLYYSLKIKLVATNGTPE